MKKGDTVKFKTYLDEGDEKARMKLLENPNGGRVRVEHLSNMYINPTNIYSIEDIEEAG